MAFVLSWHRSHLPTGWERWLWSGWISHGNNLTCWWRTRHSIRGPPTKHTNQAGEWCEPHTLIQGGVGAWSLGQGWGWKLPVLVPQVQQFHFECKISKLQLGPRWAEPSCPNTRTLHTRCERRNREKWRKSEEYTGTMFKVSYALLQLLPQPRRLAPGWGKQDNHHFEPHTNEKVYIHLCEKSIFKVRIQFDDSALFFSQSVWEQAIKFSYCGYVHWIWEGHLHRVQSIWCSCVDAFLDIFWSVFFADCSQPGETSLYWELMMLLILFKKSTPNRSSTCTGKTKHSGLEMWHLKSFWSMLSLEERMIHQSK